MTPGMSLQKPAFSFSDRKARMWFSVSSQPLSRRELAELGASTVSLTTAHLRIVNMGACVVAELGAAYSLLQTAAY